ncbi:sugar kinase [Lactococcus petauri]|uniref:sugar kinase n=1 Tax=Lactococcus petauri TaxID=1940789 RepID=UPI0031FEAFDF
MNVLAFGEVMMRLAVPNYKMLEQTESLEMSFSGTGLNILSSLAHNGVKTHLLTVLPANTVGRTARSFIRKLGVSDERILIEGQHIGSYFLEMGYGNRPSEVTYMDRSQSAFCQVKLSDEVIKTALKDITLLHICGISLSTSKQSRENALNLARIAQELKIMICFDFNYRMSLAKADEHDILIDSYKKMLHYSNVVFGSEKDLLLLLKIEHSEEEQVEKLYRKFMKEYHVSFFGGTTKVNEGNRKILQGFLASQSDIVYSQKREIISFDRIGTGDAFAAGILMGLIEDWTLQETVEFASVNAQLSYTTYGDSPIISRELIEAKLMDENIDIIR